MEGGEGEEKKRQRLPAAEASGEEEAQVEEFFVLLKSIKEMRDRCRKQLGGCCQRKRARVVPSAAWTPAFEWEDFAGDMASGRRPESAPASLENGQERKKKKKVEEDSALDLKLSL